MSLRMGGQVVKEIQIYSRDHKCDIFSVAKATLQSQMSVRLFVSPSPKPLNHHPLSFFIHPSSFLNIPNMITTVFFVRIALSMFISNSIFVCYMKSSIFVNTFRIIQIQTKPALNKYNSEYGAWLSLSFPMCSSVDLYI